MSKQVSGETLIKLIKFYCNVDKYKLFKETDKAYFIYDQENVYKLTKTGTITGQTLRGLFGKKIVTKLNSWSLITNSRIFLKEHDYVINYDVINEFNRTIVTEDYIQINFLNKSNYSMSSIEPVKSIRINKDYTFYINDMQIKPEVLKNMLETTHKPIFINKEHLVFLNKEFCTLIDKKTYFLYVNNKIKKIKTKDKVVTKNYTAYLTDNKIYIAFRNTNYVIKTYDYFNFFNTTTTPFDIIYDYKTGDYYLFDPYIVINLSNQEIIKVPDGIGFGDLKQLLTIEDKEYIVKKFKLENKLKGGQ